MEKIRILIADKGDIFRRGLVEVLKREENFEIISVCSNGFSTIEKAYELKPDIILLDIGISDCDCFETSMRIHDLIPDMHIAILTFSNLESNILSALYKTRACAYLIKGIEAEKLLGNIIEIVSEGGLYFSPDLAKQLLDEVAAIMEHGMIMLEDKIPTLNARENEILDLVAEGLTNKEIASNLFIAENTVKSHLRSIFKKLHVSRRQLAVSLVKGDMPLSNNTSYNLVKGGNNGHREIHSGIGH